MTEIELRNKVAACARSWLGRREADGSHNPIIDIYNSIVPLPVGYRMSYTDPWCAAFVSAVGKACGLTDILLPECHCDRMIALYRAAGRWQEADNYPAKVGDLVMYDWDDSGVGDNTGSADHVGIIVDANDSTLTVIEGNKSDSVAYRTISRNGRYIRGFCCPDYASKADEETEPTPEPAPAPEPEISYYPYIYRVNINLLKPGNRGPQVRSLQKLLSIEESGVYDEATTAAVKAFQRGAGLEVDGEFGGLTFAKLWNK